MNRSSWSNISLVKVFGAIRTTHASLHEGLVSLNNQVTLPLLESVGYITIFFFFKGRPEDGPMPESLMDRSH